MKCATGHCGHCQLGPAVHLQGRPGAPPRPSSRRSCRWRSCERSAASPSGSSPPATAASCRCSTARTSCSRSPAQLDIAYFPRPASSASEGEYDLSIVEGSITTAEEAERIREIRARSRRLVIDRRVRDRRRHPGAAQLRRRRGLRVDRLREPGVHLDAARLDARRRARRRRLRAPRLPARQGASCSRSSAPSSTSAGRRSPAHSVCIECKRARQRLRDGRPRHAVPRSGDARRLRRAVPELRPRLLRLLRADGARQHRLARRLAAPATACCRARRRARCTATFNAGRAGVPQAESEPHDG